MKITRRFLFLPSWDSRGFSWESSEDLKPIPSFNEIAEMLNDKGWEIKQFRYIEDKYTYRKVEAMKSLEIYCDKEINSKIEIFDEKYNYKMNKNGELEAL